jgi:hypothetical protein
MSAIGWMLAACVAVTSGYYARRDGENRRHPQIRRGGLLEQLLRVVAGLMLLRNGPQDLPARRELLYAAIAAYAFVTVLNQLVLGTPPLQALMPAAASVLLLAAFAAGVLRAGRRPERFLQSFMALLYAGAVIGLLEIGPTVAFRPYLQKIAGLIEHQADAEALRQALEQVNLPMLPVLLLSALFVWRIVVMAHVFRHALETRMANAVSIALLYPAVLFLVIVLLGRY